MNINESTILNSALESNDPLIKKTLDEVMPNQEAWWKQEYEPAPRRVFEPEAQPDALSAGLDACEPTEDAKLTRRIQVTKVKFAGLEMEEKHAVCQGTAVHTSILDPQSVLYYRRVARQMIHEGTYRGAVHCWTTAMGEGPHPTKMSLARCLKGWSWKQVGEELTQDELDQAYRLTRSNNRKLKQNRS